MRIALHGGPEHGRHIVIEDVPDDWIVHRVDGGYVYVLTPNVDERGRWVATVMND